MTRADAISAVRQGIAAAGQSCVIDAFDDNKPPSMILVTIPDRIGHESINAIRDSLKEQFKSIPDCKICIAWGGFRYEVMY